MIVFPAIDIKDGRCVRLRQGVASELTVFSDDPLQMAMHWVEQGAQWLHVVDLDGAFQGEPVNKDLIQALCSRVPVPVQLGGGIREIEAAKQYFQAGVARLIIGTMALEDAETLKSLCRAYPGQVGVSLDADNGRLKARGWVAETDLTVEQVLPELEAMGAAFVVYTDISRDGMQNGVNLDGVARVVEATSLPVIAAGGVTDLEDIKALFPLAAKGLAGVITGKAIYDHSLELKQALDWVAGQNTWPGA
ncbi:1-(5-phosphoribosyl)-5-[(5-phosphoribosylamino)methylideneamino]imidazole-4-carboxamide isomerase [Desulfovermiculus halophilus]|jgi:phosphoribosylformimino-5-aminoimidazole carboxamide ribotide isomerase|uniref:1-(5-phosphoribosyl)-5-[(5- phosphoribosylamino)methylideneamino]imidazole-4- carboxamide isomerase n=1 Tax=Desulfovermiculus halophilus TaxID=339722 RepID=UPI00047F1794|nr:1-(5-phosphoribosyl)-5-[(5-phosphoribosylamino)methylideneamino]imidazole-4-carboxamide isomerase [Desulfovermiculus halophilus]